jgi:hypothetical protein
MKYRRNIQVSFLQLWISNSPFQFEIKSNLRWIQFRTKLMILCKIISKWQTLSNTCNWIKLLKLRSRRRLEVNWKLIKNKNYWSLLIKKSELKVCFNFKKRHCLRMRNLSLLVKSDRYRKILIEEGKKKGRLLFKLKAIIA